MKRKIQNSHDIIILGLTGTMRFKSYKKRSDLYTVKTPKI